MYFYSQKGQLHQTFQIYEPFIRERNTSTKLSGKRDDRHDKWQKSAYFKKEKRKT
jgi:hypothetical protein